VPLAAKSRCGCRGGLCRAVSVHLLAERIETVLQQLALRCAGCSVTPFSQPGCDGGVLVLGGVTEDLCPLVSEALSQASLEAAARAVADTRRPDLVWSGPEVPGLHARDTRRGGQLPADSGGFLGDRQRLGRTARQESLVALFNDLAEGGHGLPKVRRRTMADYAAILLHGEASAAMPKIAAVGTGELVPPAEARAAGTGSPASLWQVLLVLVIGLSVLLYLDLPRELQERIEGLIGFSAQPFGS
jgi:hypothetical protein